MQAREKQIKYKTQGISVIGLGLKTNKFIKYVSIAEAARALNTYPIPFLRKVQYNKLYLERYIIINCSGDLNYKPKEIKIYFWYNVFPIPDKTEENASFFNSLPIKYNVK